LAKHYLRRVGFFKGGNEGVEAKGGTCRPLPPLDGRNLTTQKWSCLYESITPNLS
jgi:hypothetical protein